MKRLILKLFLLSMFAVVYANADYGAYPSGTTCSGGGVTCSCPPGSTCVADGNGCSCQCGGGAIN